MQPTAEHVMGRRRAIVPEPSIVVDRRPVSSVRAARASRAFTSSWLSCVSNKQLRVAWAAVPAVESEGSDEMTCEPITKSRVSGWRQSSSVFHENPSSVPPSCMPTSAAVGCNVRAVTNCRSRTVLCELSVGAYGFL